MLSQGDPTNIVGQDRDQSELIHLGTRLYELALVRSTDESITDPRGNPIGWLLDTRIAMLDSSCFQDVGQTLAARLSEKGATQVLGFGFGSYAIVCSILSGCQPGEVSGGFIREHRKPHGRKRLIEGPIDRSKPVVLVDDILNSGRSAITAIEKAERDGFNIVGLMTLFNFTWSAGRQKLLDRGLWVDSLLDLNLKGSSETASQLAESDGDHRN